MNANRNGVSERTVRLPLIAGAIVLALTAGCASFSSDGGFGSVQQVAQQRLNKSLLWVKSDADEKSVQAAVAKLLSQPLGVDEAVQVALLNNRGLQAAFADLGISEADLVQAGRLPNLHFSMFRASHLENGIREFKIEQALTFNFFALLTMPRAVAIERRRFEQTQHAVALEMLRLAAETRKAYYRAVAADQLLAYSLQVNEVAQASAQLAQRMAQVGNFNKLQQAREQNFYADVALNHARAKQSADQQREHLIRLLGLWGEQTSFRLPERLPDLPKAANDLPDIEQVAVAQRLDLQQVKLETQALAAQLGLTKTTRFINVFELGPARVLEGTRDANYKRGYELAFELPLFDWGDAKVARAEARYRQQLDRAAQTAIDARSEVRQTYRGYRSSFEIAQHYRDELVPLRQKIADENLLRYNGMLIGVFELLADARAQANVVMASIQAQRDFWLAQADLEMAMLGRPLVSAMSGQGGGLIGSSASGPLGGPMSSGDAAAGAH